MGKGKLVVISGSSGTGKGTVIALLRSMMPGRFALSVSVTTRAPRPGEVPGVSYNYITKEAFLRMKDAGELFEYNLAKDYYATPCSELAKMDDGTDLILEIEVNGAEKVKEKRPDAIMIFLAPPDMDTLETRLRARNTEKEDDILRRLSIAREEMKRIPAYDYVVVNHDGRADEAAKEILNILDAEAHRTANQSELIASLSR